MNSRPRPADAAPDGRILEPGRNCWRIARAGRAAVLVDAADYFARLDSALRQARRSIVIIGWDFDASIALHGHGGAEPAEQLGTLLRSLVDGTPELEIRILVWNLSTIHAPGAAAPLVLGEEWSDHERIRLRFDHNHPVYAAQHQKIVVIDDSLAFVGGMDLTVGRWDTPDHAPGDPGRVNADGESYEPVHDIQMAVDGAAARAVGELARARWTFATGEAAPSADAGEPWPEGLAPDFEAVDVAISRTAPKWGGEPAVREIGLLTIDALRAARRRIYIEAQYLADFRVGDCLAERLAEPEGPDVVIVVTRFPDALLERRFMGENRNRLIRRLTRADRHGRMRTYCLSVPGEGGGCGVFVHSKLLIVDDDLLRIGSANLNNRSTGLDSECDLAIEADSDEVRTRIAAVRARLIAEHAGVEPEEVAEAERATGSLIAAIEAIDAGACRLDRITVPERGPVRPVFGSALVDPRRPIPFTSLIRWWWRRLKPVTSRHVGRHRSVRGMPVR